MIGTTNSASGSIAQRAVERSLVVEMSKYHSRMVDSLEYFRNDKKDFDNIKELKETEILMTNRFIKKEIIDMADLMEEMNATIINQGIMLKTLMNQQNGADGQSRRESGTLEPVVEERLRAGTMNEYLGDDIVT